jgi:hypothetical protein
MRTLGISVLIFAGVTSGWPQAGELKTADAVLHKYQAALGGVDAIQKVESVTLRGEAEATGIAGKATFVFYAKPFKGVQKFRLPDGTENISGFDGRVSWSVTPKGASIDKDTPLESVRRDADLQYPLHQPDYFQKLELAGVVDFEGRRCYWLHGTTHWAKDNNQFYDVQTGLLAGYRFQSDSSTSAVVTKLLFQEYKSFGGPLVATRQAASSGDNHQTLTITSVSYAPLEDSIFELPPAVKALLK